MKNLTKNLVLMAVVALAAINCFAAGELDNLDTAINAQRIEKGTTVLRIDTRDNSAAMIYTDEVMNSPEQAAALVTEQAALFKALPKDKLIGELDREGAASSWYFYWNTGYYYPTYYYPTYYYPTYYYPTYYYPYYNYGYGYYNYYYYGCRGWY